MRSIVAVALQSRPVGAVLDLFCELAAIPSPPGQERAVADRVIAELRDLGLDHTEDDAGAKIGGTPGTSSRGSRRPRPARRSSSARTSTRCRRPRRSSRSSRTASCATRPGRSSAPTTSRRSRRCSSPRSGSSTRAGRTRGSSSSSRPRRRRGSRAPRSSTWTRSSRRSGSVTTTRGRSARSSGAAPSSTSVDAVFRGRAAHAGMSPEDGRSAIAAAARAIADLRLGRIDEETTANVGTIEGGTARNIVPEFCTRRRRGALARPGQACRARPGDGGLVHLRRGGGRLRGGRDARAQVRRVPAGARRRAAPPGARPRSPRAGSR